MKIPEKIAKFKSGYPYLSQDAIIAFMLRRGLLPEGYHIERGFRLEVPTGRGTGTASIASKWIVYNDGKAEFSGDTEQDAMDFVMRCRRLNGRLK